MSSSPSPRTDRLLDAWIRVRQIVAQAIENPATNEEVENLIGSLGPVYEDYPELILDDLQRMPPEIGLEAIEKAAPGFDVSAMEPRELVSAAVEAVMNLRAIGKAPSR